MAKLAITGEWNECAEIMHTLGKLSDASDCVVKPLSEDKIAVCMVDSDSDFEGLSHYKIFTFSDFKKTFKRNIGDSVCISEGNGVIKSMSWDIETENMCYILTFSDCEETRTCQSKDFIDYHGEETI